MAKKKKAAVDPAALGKEMFDTMFCSFSVILLAFFILLNSFATMDARRIRVTLGSLIGTFGLGESGANVLGEGDIYSRVRSPMDGEDAEQVTAADAFGLFLNDEGLSPYVELVEEDGKKLLRFRESVLFPSGGDAISPKVFPVLDRLAEVIRTMERPVLIEGHTDPVPTTHGEVGNWGLSAARAVAVMRFLTEAAGVPDNMVRAVGRGAGARLGKVDDPDDFNRSRRVDIVFL